MLQGQTFKNSAATLPAKFKDLVMQSTIFRLEPHPYR
jgi:hypothetical protein